MYRSVEQANYAFDESQARVSGHEIEVVCTWMIEDDADFHAECKCGWKSQDVRAGSHARQLGKQHIKEMAANLRKASNAAQ